MDKPAGSAGKAHIGMLVSFRVSPGLLSGPAAAASACERPADAGASLKLCWCVQHVSYTVRNSQKPHNDIKLLEDVMGYLRPGELVSLVSMRRALHADPNALL